MRLFFAAAILAVLSFGSVDAAFVNTWGADATDNLYGSLELCSLDDCYSATISWEITEYDDGWKYCYFFDGDQDLSHLILEVTRDCDLAIVFGNEELDPQLWEYAGNIELSNSIYGVKFDDLSSNYVCFFSDRDPVYGSVAAKSGRNVFFNCEDYIPRPDGDFTPVPEPATMAMFGVGIGAASLARRRKCRGPEDEEDDEDYDDDDEEDYDEE